MGITVFFLLCTILLRLSSSSFQPDDTSVEKLNGFVGLVKKNELRPSCWFGRCRSRRRRRRSTKAHKREMSDNNLREIMDRAQTYQDEEFDQEKIHEEP